MLKHMRNLLGGALLAIALGIPYLQAADVAISALPAGTTLTGTEAIPAVQSATTVKTTPAAIKTYVETGGTVTASDPVLDMSQTWNNAAVPFTGLKFNVTDTASDAASNLLVLQRNGNNVLRVGKDTLYIYGGDIAYMRSTVAYASTQFQADGATAGFVFNNGSGNYSGFWYGGAAGLVDMRAGAYAQSLRIYNTYTDASNYERIAIIPGAASGWQQIAAQTAGTGTDNIGIALTPAGTGALSAHVPNNAASGGNARGAYAVDWQPNRDAASKVASGQASTIGGGENNTASGYSSTIAGGSAGVASATGASVIGGYLNQSTANYAISGGSTNTASAAYAVALGSTNTASGQGAVALGSSNTATGARSWIPGGLQATTRGLVGAYAYSAGQRNALGDAQVIGQPVRRTTTDATPVSLATDGTPAATTIMIVPDGAVMMCTALVVAKPSASITDGVGFDIEGLVYRSGSTTALLSIPNSTAHGGNPLALAATFVANDTLEGLEIQVTGAAATTIYWAGELKCVQVL